MKTLDLKKNSIDNFVKTEELAISQDTWEQDIQRCWEFLKVTHTLENRHVISDLYWWYDYYFPLEQEQDSWYNEIPDTECVCIRALIEHKKTKRRIGNHEHIIRSFDDTGFLLFKRFMKKHLFHRDAVYNFFYNIYKPELFTE